MKEEIVSSRLLLEAKIDQFYLKDEREKQGEQVVQVPDSEDEFDRVSGIRLSGQVIAHIDDSSEDEEEQMSLNPRKGLKDLLARRRRPRKGRLFHPRTLSSKK